MTEMAARLQSGRMDLNSREVEALQLMADHGSYKAVAGRMFLSPETVKSHLRMARLKLGAKNTTNAVALAFRAGLIT